MDHVELDLASFLFVITAPVASREYEIADQTIKLLDLNNRERLREKREWAYGQYLRVLSDYVRDLGTPCLHING